MAMACMQAIPTNYADLADKFPLKDLEENFENAQKSAKSVALRKNFQNIDDNVWQELMTAIQNVDSRALESVLRKFKLPENFSSELEDKAYDIDIEFNENSTSESFVKEMAEKHGAHQQTWKRLENTMMQKVREVRLVYENAIEHIVFEMKRQFNNAENRKKSFLSAQAKTILGKTSSLKYLNQHHNIKTILEKMANFAS